MANYISNNDPKRLLRIERLIRKHSETQGYGISYREIAELEGCSLSTAHKYVELLIRDGRVVRSEAKLTAMARSLRVADE